MKHAIALLVLALLAGAGLDGGGLEGGALKAGGMSGGALSAPAGDVVAAPTFDLNPTTSGNSLMSDSLSDTGATLVISCTASQITGTTWPCATGGTFNEAGSGTSPSPGKLAPVLDGSEAVAFASNQKYFNGPSGAGSIGTNDFVVEYLIRNDSNLSGGYLGTLNVANTDGWSASFDNNIRLSIYTSAGAGVTAQVAHSSTYRWVYATCFVDRDHASGQVCCANGTCGTAANPTLHDGTSMVGADMDIGNTGSGANTQSGSQISFVRVWTCDDCLNTANFTSIHKDRLYTLTGLDPAIALGSDAPTTMSRASFAYSDIDTGTGVRQLLLLGSNMFRPGRRADTGASYHTGLLIEPAATNLWIRSEELDNASWTKLNATIGANATAAPNGLTTADSVTATSATTPQAYVSTLISASTQYTGSRWLKYSSGSGWIQLVDFAASACLTGSPSAWVDVQNCATGTLGSGLTTVTAEDWGNGWCRVAVTGTTTGAATSCNPGIRLVTADNTATGDNGAVVYMWGAQFETGPLATSYITTTTASATRAADDLRYSSTSNAGTSGTLAVQAMTPSYNANSSPGQYLAAISDTSSNNRSVLYIDGAGVDHCAAIGSSGGATSWSISLGNGFNDGDSHECRVTYVTDDVNTYYDGAASGTPDTSATMQGAPTTIGIGGSHAGTAQLSGLLERVRIWDEVVTP